ncbi:MAG: hypothetical protein JWQ79_2893 [Mucilaginibacter sp.]|jgi:hypothetical protein|nr:hypothetical protein [Mucilaginibacter sp.]
MGLPLRITFNDKDYIYQILNSKLVNQNTTELEILFNGETVALVMDSNKTWVQKDQSMSIDPELVQALGRSVSLRLRM